MAAARLELRPWTPDDLILLERQNTAEMTAFLGGPESAEKVRRRNEIFLRGQEDGTTFPFVAVVEGEPEPVGSIVYWETTHHDHEVYECGWAILPEHQGKGYATRAVRLGIAHAVEHGDRAEMWAFPRIDNTSSNALAHAAGMRLVGEEDGEYPKGVPIRVNAWVADLAAARASAG